MNVKGIVIFMVFILLSSISVDTTCSYEKAENGNFIDGSNNGNILYVGGNGPNNYTHIQDAIDNASNGDTIFVYDDSSPYYENVVIGKSISLAGEDKNTTIIDGKRNGSVIYVNASNAEISGFSITNGSTEWLEGGIKLYHSVHVNIHGNILYNNCIGIFLYLSNCNFITDNILRNNTEEGIRLIDSMNNDVDKNTVIGNGWVGITISRSSNNRVANNTITRNVDGIWIWYGSDNNEIRGNIINFNIFGMDLSLCGKNKIKGNTFKGNALGITLWWSQLNIINKNNFFFNGIDAFFCNSFLNIWLRNFWGRPRLAPKPIIGVINFFPYYIFLIWLNFDWMPRMMPYRW